MTKYKAGQIAIGMLQVKMDDKGIDLRNAIFIPKLKEEAKRISCTDDELLQFYMKYLMPPALKACGMNVPVDQVIPTEREAELGLKVLTQHNFWNLGNLRNEAFNISNKIKVDCRPDDVAAIVLHIVRDHISSEFGEEPSLRLEFSDDIATMASQ